jgi:maleylpyruvate isomerase
MAIPGVDALAEAHEQLRGHLHVLLGAGLLDDGTARGPSLLPGWSRGHVLSHIARNADSVTRGLSGAMAGQSVARYAGPPGTRDREIDEGAPRSAAELVADVVDSSRTLDSAIGLMTDTAWTGSCLGPVGDEPVADLPMVRLREVERPCCTSGSRR